MRIRLDIAYDGTNFHGWARQPGLRTVQGELEHWLTRVLRHPTPIELTVAGRTDAGVHARGQVAHLDLEPAHEQLPELLVHRLGRVLPDDVVVSRASVAPAGFDARFSAIWRSYCYRVLPGGSPVDPLLSGHVVRLRDGLNLDEFNHAAKSLLGLRDFAPFCKPHAGATTIRKLHELFAFQRDDSVVEIRLRADAFCHSMVRSLVGALCAVASGRRSQGWLSQVANYPMRHNEVTVMPAKGLVLEEVGYPPDEDLAERALVARNIRKLD